MADDLKLSHIGILTSGGDGPGMNAFIRAAVRTGLEVGCRVTGIERGYQGMLERAFVEMNSRSVGGIMRHGGTILQTSRCPEFMTFEGREAAIENLRSAGIQGVVVAGGNGSMAGVHELHVQGYPAVGVPATIDNDLYGTDTCIGVDTALNTIIEAVDRLKDTASSHRRAFVVEVMGRHSGWLALTAGLAGGAEAVLVPEEEFSIPAIVDDARAAFERGKPHYIIIASEALRLANGPLSADFLRAMEASGFPVRVTVLGHVQRGGPPTVGDRLLASRFGAEATMALMKGGSDAMIGIQGGKLVRLDLERAVQRTQGLPDDLVELAGVLAQ